MKQPKSEKQWGWWDGEKGQFRHIYPSRLCVEMCFPDGGKSCEIKELGKIMEVIISPAISDESTNKDAKL